MSDNRLLIIEDDADFASLLGRYLERVGFHADVESSGEAALNRIRGSHYDVVVLDGNLPDLDGFEVCRRMRPEFSGQIVMLTARSEDLDRIQGLSLGADDYLLKPVHPQVVVAHIQARLRARKDDQPPEDERRRDVVLGRFRISQSSRTATLDGLPIELSTTEFDLLWVLASRAGWTLSRDDIMAALRGLEHDGIDRSIDMRISRLRRRLGDDPEDPQLIKTVRGKGYLFSQTGW